MSFTLDGDIYIRYLSFKTAKVRQRRTMSMFRRCLNRPRRPVQDMEKDMIKRNPEKIDIGAIYNIPAMDRMSVADGAFIPQEREFVIDIDLSDYNDVRTCCDGEPPPAAPAAPSPASRRRRSHCAALAPQPPASARGAGRTCPSPSRSSIPPCAVRSPSPLPPAPSPPRIRLTPLGVGTEDFGFKHIMWVYSGRRGVHCWVADRRARLLSNDGRSAVAEYLSCYVGTGGSNGRQVDLTYPLHPRMRKVYDEVLKDQFEFLLISDQQILNGEDDRQRGIENALLDMIQDPDVQKKVRDRFSRCTSGEEKWHALKDEISKLQANIQRGRGGISTTMRRTANAIEDIVFAHLYPVRTSPSPLPFAPPLSPSASSPSSAAAPACARR